MIKTSNRDRKAVCIYRSRQVAGLLIVGAAILAFALARANWHEVFPVGWWHF